MLNFTGKIRRDILLTKPAQRQECLAMLAAFLDTSGFSSFGLSDRRDEFSFTSENEEVAEYFLALVDKLFGVSMTVTEATRDPKHGRNKLTFSYSGENAFDYADEITDYSACNLEEESDMRAYLKGAFLGSGSCTLPRGGAKTGYHLEFVFPYEVDAEFFCEMLDKLQLIASIIPRGEKYVVYCKNREVISDFLGIMDAGSALKQFEEVSAARDESNNNNRKGNCDAGNADKSAIASAAQIHAFRLLESKGVLQTLAAPLRDTASARTENPTLSMQELAKLLGISKSCLNHRLRKLMQIYAKEEKEI
ncbi:MAG: DNA-binding protein WhiA [Clostridia bacterium]|nr:DNA-binding protein WhiA [Clostridia bacterium]